MLVAVEVPWHVLRVLVDVALQPSRMPRFSIDDADRHERGSAPLPPLGHGFCLIARSLRRDCFGRTNVVKRSARRIRNVAELFGNRKVAPNTHRRSFERHLPGAGHARRAEPNRTGTPWHVQAGESPDSKSCCLMSFFAIFPYPDFGTFQTKTWWGHRHLAQRPSRCVRRSERSTFAPSRRTCKPALAPPDFRILNLSTRH